VKKKTTSAIILNLTLVITQVTQKVKKTIELFLI
jgi:hypothetical protein